MHKIPFGDSPRPSFVPPQRLIMGPGPSPAHPRVLAAMAQPTLSHLDPAFQGLMDVVKAGLRAVFATRNDVTFPVSGPGSAAMEMALAMTLSPGDIAVIGRNGVFGARMVEMAKRLGADVRIVDAPWGEALDPDAVAAALRAAGPVKALAFVHAETSTGALSDAQTLAALGKAAGALVIADCVTSLIGSELRIDEWGIDIAFSGSQKCLSGPAGISPLTVSPTGIAAIKARRTKPASWFFDLEEILAYWSAGDGARVYHHTAPIQSIYGLAEALALLTEEGIEAARARHRACGAALKAGLTAMGLDMPVQPGAAMAQLTPVRPPEGLREEDIRALMLSRHGVEFGAGLGPLKGRIFRIGLMGYGAQGAHVTQGLEALDEVLTHLGRGAQGAGAAAASRALDAAA